MQQPNVACGIMTSDYCASCVQSHCLCRVFTLMVMSAIHALLMPCHHIPSMHAKYTAIAHTAFSAVHMHYRRSVGLSGCVSFVVILNVQGWLTRTR